MTPFSERHKVITMNHLVSINTPMLIVLSFFLLFSLFDAFVEILNMRHARKEGLPEEFRGFCDEEKYQQSQKYLIENTRFSLWSTAFSVVVTIFFIIFGGFAFIDEWARSFEFGMIITGLIFIFTLGFLSWITQLPFSFYHTFVLEEKYGFNKTTIKTYITDLLKGTLLGLLIGAPLLSAVLWFFAAAGDRAWIYAWGMLIIAQIFFLFIAPIWIMPLFNRFVPLAEGELKEAIEKYANKQQFKLKGIFTMDGSKRSTKANAFFTGFGRFRRIVLFDTLLEKHNTNELVAVLAHEIGHFKKKHVIKFLFISLISSGLMFYVFSLGINHDFLFSAFAVPEKSIYASLVFLAFLYSPISMILGVITNSLSRKFEFEADNYAATTTGAAQDLIIALKKLSIDSLSNLNPHPLKVFLEYSHPPVSARIKKLSIYG